MECDKKFSMNLHEKTNKQMPTCELSTFGI